MKIILILAAGKRYRRAVEKGKVERYYAPTTLLRLKSIIPHELNPEVRIIDQGVEPVPEEMDADLVGISAITCAAPEAYRLAERIRKRGIPVVLGGSHPTLLPGEASRYADSVVVGFGEGAWRRLLLDFASGKLKKIYCDFSNPYSRSYPPLHRNLLSQRYFTRNTIEVTRGCPHACSFCVVSRINGGKGWCMPVRDAVREIEMIGSPVVFLDVNLFAFRDYAKKLMNEIAPLRVEWYAGATLNLVQDKEMLKLAEKSGCRGLLVGFESVNQESLNWMGKGFHRKKYFYEAVKILHDHGMSVLGCFVFGCDPDDESIFERTVRFVEKSGMDLVKYSILTPLPGSYLFEKFKKEKRLLTLNWELYDGEHCVFLPRNLSPEKLEEGLRWAYRITYRFSSILKRTLRKGSPFPHAFLANLVFKKLSCSVEV